jgi:hypothetical protein
MSRRRLICPPGTRWLAVGIAAVVLARAVAWVTRGFHLTNSQTVSALVSAQLPTIGRDTKVSG